MANPTHGARGAGAAGGNAGRAARLAAAKGLSHLVAGLARAATSARPEAAVAASCEAGDDRLRGQRRAARRKVTLRRAASIAAAVGDACTVQHLRQARPHVSSKWRAKAYTASLMCGETLHRSNRKFDAVAATRVSRSQPRTCPKVHEDHLAAPSPKVSARTRHSRRGLLGATAQRAAGGYLQIPQRFAAGARAPQRQEKRA
jgi:hypothetical protein